MTRRKYKKKAQSGAGVFKGNKRQRGTKKKNQQGGAFGAGMAAGMLMPLVMGTVGKVLKINV